MERLHPALRPVDLSLFSTAFIVCYMKIVTDRPLLFSKTSMLKEHVL